MKKLTTVAIAKPPFSFGRDALRRVRGRDRARPSRGFAITSTVIMVALASAAAFGELSWATVNTMEYDNDASTPPAGSSAYSGYLCTVAAAQAKFGASSIGGVTEYFAKNFAAGSSALQSLSSGTGVSDGSKLVNGATLLDAVEWGKNQYSFTTYFASGSDGNLVAGSEYLGIILYSSDDDQAVRVFSATASDSGPTWVADDSSSRSAGSAGDWTPVEDVPEPTSGLLLLLGLAGLALKRKCRM